MKNDTVYIELNYNVIIGFYDITVLLKRNYKKLPIRRLIWTNRIFTIYLSLIIIYRLIYDYLIGLYVQVGRLHNPCGSVSDNVYIYLILINCLI